MADNRGIVFIATGEEYVAEAVDRAAHLKQIRPECSIALCSNLETNQSVFDYEIDINEPQFTLTDKVENIGRSPFEKTIFLDTDTFVVDETAFDELWGLLDRVSVAAGFDIARSEQLKNESIIDSRPPISFPMLNTGVLVYQQPAADPLFERWLEYHQKFVQAGDRNINDQIAFRLALWETDIQYSIIPPEFNFIVPSPQFAAEEVQILHGDAGNYAEIARALNERTPLGGRIYHPVYTASESPEISPWVAGANEQALYRSIRRSLLDFGILRTLLYIGAGLNPITGQKRINRFLELIRTEGWSVAIKKSINHLRR